MSAPRGAITLDARSANATPEDKPLLEQTEEVEPEVLLLKEGDGEKISKALDMPELTAELERAVWQVRQSMKSEQELEEEKESLKREAKKDLEDAKKAAGKTADDVINGTKKD